VLDALGGLPASTARRPALLPTWAAAAACPARARDDAARSRIHLIEATARKAAFIAQAAAELDWT
jgi:hypothetical protein